MRACIALACIACVACHQAQPAPQNVTLAPASASASSEPVVAPYAENARSAFDAAEALDRAGRTNEAHTAYEEIVRKYAYTRFAGQARERLASLDGHATVGDVTCRTDDDCAVTTRLDCCECCPRRALATSKKWLEWRDSQECATERCRGCEESCKPETGRSATCSAGKCQLTKK